MKKYKTQKAIDNHFSRFFDQLEKANTKEVDYYNSIPYGYASRAYTKFKKAPDYMGRVREKARVFLESYTVNPDLLEKAKRVRLI